MVYRTALSISLLIAPLGLSASAQTADDYFHGGAQSYIHSEKEKAMQQVVTGLQKFPDDPKLNGLVALLKKQEEEQKQQQQQQQQQDQKKDQSKDEQKQNSQSQQDKQDQQKDSSEQ